MNRKTTLAILVVLILGGAYLLMNQNRSSDTDDVYAGVQVPLVDRKIVEELLAKNYHGERTDAGNWHWVDVVNINPVQQNFRNGWSWLAYGETCGAGRSDDGEVMGGTIQVRGEVNGKVLYEYTARGNPVGTPCPSGILFFAEKEGGR